MRILLLLSVSLAAQPLYEQANAHLQAGRLAEASFAAFPGNRQAARCC